MSNYLIISMDRGVINRFQRMITLDIVLKIQQHKLQYNL